MLYRSSRGGVEGRSFEHVLYQGLAEDGGLYLPHYIPMFTLDQMNALMMGHDSDSSSSTGFVDVAFAIMRPYITREEVGDEELRQILTASFATFKHDHDLEDEEEAKGRGNPTPVKPLPRLRGKDQTNSHPLYVLELFHGPTCAFKDVALQVLGNLFQHFQARKSHEDWITVLGATSGDTGGAAIYGLRGKDRVNIFILHPKDRISPIQYDQMTTVLDPHVHNIAVEGSFDDCQDIVKQLFTDAPFKNKHGLAAINSINWARILAQIIYYFQSYFQLCRQTKRAVGELQVRYSVPSGNFGDALAGYYAKRMGLPIHSIIVATNANDILHRFFSGGGVYEKRAGEDPVSQTLSPAMDILVSSNFERLAWYYALGDGRASQSPETLASEPTQDACRQASAMVKQWMSDLREKGRFEMDPSLFANSFIVSHATDDASTLDTIHRYYFEGDDGKGLPFSYVLDPHTAVGVIAAEHVLRQCKYEPSQSVITVCLSTASPGKFPAAVLGVINANASMINQPLTFDQIAPPCLVGLDALPKNCLVVPSRRKLPANAKTGRLLDRAASVRMIIEALTARK